MKDHIIVTGGAGFIGSNLVYYLLDKGHGVKVIDNLSSGKKEYLKSEINENEIDFFFMDLKDRKSCVKNIKDADVVFHLAANPEVRLLSSPREIFDDNVLSTINVLEAMRINNIKQIVFMSSSCVYGEPEIKPTPTNYPLQPISIYGASKMACEALISGYSYQLDFKSLVIRPANVVGYHSTHGVIIDFIKKLMINSKKLEILGDGSQKKSYIEVKDFIRAVYYAYLKFKNSDSILSICNISNLDSTNVDTIADIVIKEMKLSNVKKVYTGGVESGRAWKGDVREVLLDSLFISDAGWKPKFSSDIAVREAVRSILAEMELNK